MGGARMLINFGEETGMKEVVSIPFVRTKNDRARRKTTRDKVTNMFFQFKRTRIFIEA